MRGFIEMGFFVFCMYWFVQLVNWLGRWWNERKER